MTLEEMHNKIKEYESKWGKLGHTNIMKPEKYTIEHSGLSKGETKMPNMTNDFYAFRRKVAEGREKNKIAHTATINITDLNKRYFEQITTDGTLIHSNIPYGQGYYQKIEKYYPDGRTRYFSKAEWDAYQEELKRNQYEQQKKVDQAKQSTGAKATATIDAEARSKWEADQKVKKANEAAAKKESDANKNTRAAQANTVLEAEKQGGTKAAIDAFKKTDAYKEYFNKIYKRIAEAGIDPDDITNVEKKTLFTKEENDEIDKLENELDAIIKQLDKKNAVKRAIKEDFMSRAQEIYKSNNNSHREADREEGRERSKWEREQKEKKEKQAKLDADRAKNEAAAKAKSEEEENKSKMSRDKEKNRQADLAEEEREKNKGVTSQTGKSAPKVRDDSDFKKNSGVSSGMSWGKNNKPLTDEEIDELEEAGKPSADALSRQASKEKHKENVNKRNAELEDRKSEREKEIADKKATTKNAHKENPEDYIKRIPKTTNPKNTKEEIVAPKKTSDNNKSLTIAERDELLKDASNNRVSVSELASKYGISEEEVEKLISGVLGGGFRHSAINEEDSVMSEYRAFKRRANEGAKRNRLSHSAVISPADLNAKYYQDIEDHCFLVHASNQYGKQHYNKIDNYYSDGRARYFWSKAEWDAYQDGLKRTQYEKEQKAKKSTGAAAEDVLKNAGRSEWEAQQKKNAAETAKQAKIQEAYNKNKAAEEPYKREALDPKYRETKNKIREAYKKNEAAGKATNADKDRYESNWEKDLHIFNKDESSLRNKTDNIRYECDVYIDDRDLNDKLNNFYNAIDMGTSVSAFDSSGRSNLDSSIFSGDEESRKKLQSRLKKSMLVYEQDIDKFEKQLNDYLKEKYGEKDWKIEKDHDSVMNALKDKYNETKKTYNDISNDYEQWRKDKIYDWFADYLYKGLTNKQDINYLNKVGINDYVETVITNKGYNNVNIYDALAQKTIKEVLEKICKKTLDKQDKQDK